MTVLKLRSDAPHNAQTLIRRLVLSDPEMQARDIFALLEGAGIQISLASVGIAVSDARAMIKLLEAEGLLRSGFEERRLDVRSDFVVARSAAAPAPARSKRDQSRGRT